MLRTDDARRRTMDVGRWMMDAGPSTPYYKLTGELKMELAFLFFSDFQIGRSEKQFFNKLLPYYLKQSLLIFLPQLSQTRKIHVPRPGTDGTYKKFTFDTLVGPGCPPPPHTHTWFMFVMPLIRSEHPLACTLPFRVNLSPLKRGIPLSNPTHS